MRCGRGRSDPVSLPREDLELVRLPTGYHGIHEQGGVGEEDVLVVHSVDDQQSVGPANKTQLMTRYRQKERSHFNGYFVLRAYMRERESGGVWLDLEQSKPCFLYMALWLVDDTGQVKEMLL